MGITFETSDGDVVCRSGEMKRIDTDYAMVCRCGNYDCASAQLKRTAKQELVQRGWKFIGGEWKCRNCWRTK